MFHLLGDSNDRLGQYRDHGNYSECSFVIDGWYSSVEIRLTTDIRNVHSKLKFYLQEWN
jgi:hypothetical protein